MNCRRTSRQPIHLVRFLCLLVAAGLFTQRPGTAASPQNSGDFHLGQLDFGKLNNQQFDFQQTPSQFQPIIVETILDLVPKKYENEKKWGRTKEIVSGLDVKFRDGQLRTKRRRKQVNHGTWKRYTVSLVDPKEFFELQVRNLREESPGLAAFELAIRAKLDVSGRLQEWRRGVRLMSISAEAIADVTLDLDCRLTSKLDASHLPPDILMQPKIVKSKARLVQLKLERLSKADGPVVREFGDGLEKILRRKLADKNEKLTAKINRQIEKKQDDMRISFRDMVSSGLLGKDGSDSDGDENAEIDEQVDARKDDNVGDH